MRTAFPIPVCPRVLCREECINPVSSSSRSQLFFQGVSLLYAAVFVFLLALHPGSPLFYKPYSDICQLLSALFACVCSLACARGMQPGSRPRLGGLLIGVGMFSWATGQAFWTYQETIVKITPPFPGGADIGFTAAFPFLIAGVFVLSGVSSAQARARLLLDSAIALSSIAILSWHFLIQHIWQHSGVSAVGKLVSVGYPLGDLATAFVALVILNGVGLSVGVRRAFLLLVGGILLAALADTCYCFQNLRGTYHTGNLYEAGWVVGYLLIGHAALLALRHRQAEASVSGKAPLLPSSSVKPFVQIFTPYAAVLAAFWLVATQDYQATHTLSGSTFISGIVLILLVVVRQCLTLLENQRMLRLCDRTAELEALNVRLRREAAERGRVEEALRVSEQRFKSLFEKGVNSSVCLDREGRVVAVNPRMTALVGFTTEELIVGPDFQFVVPEDRDRVQEILARTLCGENQQYELQYRHTDGHAILVSGWSIPVMVDGRSEGMYLLARDITAQHQAERKAQELALIVETSHDAIVGTVPDGTIRTWNRGAECLYGYTTAEAVGKSIGFVFPEEQAGEMPRLLKLVEHVGSVLEYEAIRVCKDRTQRTVSVTLTPLHDAQGTLTGHAAISRDITAQKALEAERERLLAEALDRADRDPLTGLLNHRAFHKRLEEEADRAQRAGRSLAVAVMDLDNFKFFNDAYGHQAGDDVLRQVTQALQGGCRSYDTLARFGGDEFAVLMPDVDATEGSALASRLRESVALLGYRPVGHDSDIPLSLSIGLAIFPDEAAARLDAVALADSRLYRAKTGGDGGDEADRLRARMSDTVQGFSMLDALVAAVDNKDRYTRRHSEDVMAYSLMIARELGMSDEEQHLVGVAALLHDVGKIGVPDALLRKPGRLTDAETQAMQQHPLMGSVIVGAVAGLEGTLDAVRHHHERWDGGGYPFGLRGAETPLIARLMAVADAFSAMTTDRPYRKGMSAVRALAILADGAGTQWDPQCVRAFVSARTLGEDTLVRR